MDKRVFHNVNTYVVNKASSHKNAVETVCSIIGKGCLLGCGTASKHWWKGIIAALFLQTACAEASPAVTVTVKNLGASPIIRDSVNNNHRYTLMNAHPTPKAQIRPSEEDTFAVDNNVGEGTNYAELHYTMGTKACNFRSLFVNKMVGYKTYIPQWFKFATPQGGARCTADIISADLKDHSWHVVFTMK
ncbi:hypothetical protein [Zymobacter palmae]|uniref:hypothetical protein n=1 Tax=Zymobacter palmae TaxID=33074 RepID=UPI000688BB05|nr:hypothetical protein [Zymobacter palmae]